MRARGFCSIQKGLHPEDHRTDESTPPRETAIVGARWAAGLGAALLLALALLTATRRLGQPAAEEIVQIPVATASPTPTPRPELLAPDPGDHP